MINNILLMIKFRVSERERRDSYDIDKDNSIFIIKKIIFSLLLYSFHIVDKLFFYYYSCILIFCMSLDRLLWINLINIFFSPLCFKERTFFYIYWFNFFPLLCCFSLCCVYFRINFFLLYFIFSLYLSCIFKIL